MKQELVKSPIGELEIRQRIKTIRGVQVMLDWDIAELYGVETRSLNQAVKRNKERFPQNFRFQLTKNELSELITICDQFGNFVFFHAKHEVIWKPFAVSAHSLVQRAHRNPVQFSQVSIQHDLNAADCPNPLLNLHLPIWDLHHFLLHVHLSFVR